MKNHKCSETATAPQATLVSRRGLVKLGIVSSTGILAACGTNEGDFGSQWVAELEDLLDGDVVDFEYPEGHAAFAVRLAVPGRDGVGPRGDVVAFHRACPHQGCPLTEIDATAGKVGPCACHLSEFDLMSGGSQLTGRASTPLVQVLLEVREHDVFAVGIRGVPFGEAFTVEEGR